MKLFFWPRHKKFCKKGEEGKSVKSRNLSSGFTSYKEKIKGTSDREGQNRRDSLREIPAKRSRKSQRSGLLSEAKRKREKVQVMRGGSTGKA